MPVNVSAVLPGAIPFKCHLSEAHRVTIYRVPQFFQRAVENFSSVVLEVDNFRAGVTTSPEDYFKQNDLSGQFAVDPEYRTLVRENCSKEDGASGRNLHVVLQARQDLNNWPATDGQCWKADLGRGEHLIFADGGVHPVPQFDSKPHWRNVALAAVRIGFDVPGSFEEVADQTSFRATDYRWLDLLRLSVSIAEGSTSTPITADALREKVQVVKSLAYSLKEQSGTRGVNSAPLGTLLEALQLNPLTDDAYRRLWYLRLHDRCRRFLHSQGRKIEQEIAFKDVNNHRHAIAHEGIERINLGLMQQLQIRAYDVIRQHVTGQGQ